MQKLLNNTSESIYLHIPFCLKKCNYCSFVSFRNISDYEDVYIQALCKEIESFRNDKIINTVYLGGGTPNLLKIESIEKIVRSIRSSFSLADNAEFSMEFNPAISDTSYIKNVKELGINRISLGAQSFNDEILTTLGRIHSAQDTFNFISHLDEAGISNYSLDLIYGVFGQTIEKLRYDLDIITRLSPNHVSTYGLKIEHGTPFYSYPKNTLPNEDLCADMYLMISDMLKHVGYKHYEISNFAKDNYISKHNMQYWKGNEYYGFGVSAHGYLNKMRYKNTDNLRKYIENPFHKEIISENKNEDIIEEKIFLGLRTSEGVDFNELKKTFGMDLYQQKRHFIENIVESGHAVLDKNKLFLTEKGFLISNYIMSELI